MKKKKDINKSMIYYQSGLDFKTKGMKKGGIIQDNLGQLKHPGKITKINSNNITMKGVDFPVLGISDVGDTKLMLPNNDYLFKGNSVTEYPIMKKGKSGLNIKKSKKAQVGMEALAPQGATQITLDNIPQQQMIFDPLTGQIGNQYASLLKTPKTSDFGAQDVLNIGTEVVKGASMLQDQRNRRKGVKQQSIISDLVLQATNSSRKDKIKRKYARPEDMTFSSSELTSPYGRGTDFLAKHGKEVKKAQYGGQQAGQIGSFFGETLTGTQGAQTAEGQIGGTLGGTAGMLIGGPVGAMVGQAAGSFIGSIVGAKGAKKEQKMKNQISSNLQQAAISQVIDDRYRAFMENGGEMRTGGNLRRNEGIKNYNLGGDLKTLWGGNAELISHNPFLPQTGESVLFKGQSHEESDGKGRTGIGVAFGKTKVEVEGGEPAMKLKDGSSGKDNLVIFGNMKIPNYGVSEIGDESAKGMKFKNYINKLNKQESKQNNKLDKGMNLINDNSNVTSFDKLQMSTGEAISLGATMHLKDIAGKKKSAANVQKAILETAEDLHLDADLLAKGKFKKAKNGGNYQAGGEISRISRDEVEAYMNEGWQQDPNDSNRLFKKSSTTGKTETINVGEYNAGSVKFQQAFAEARKKGLSQFTFNNKPYTTDLWKGSTKTITTPGTERTDYLDIYDPDLQETVKVPSEQVVNEEIPFKGLGAMDLLSGIIPMIRPRNRINLDPSQLSGEMFALATNQQEPVQAQLYQPLLENVSDVSFQDRLNENQATFNAISRVAGNNPSALSALAAEKYSADNAVLAEQFRTNQSERMGVYNRNRQVLNDATLKNLQILDNQYVRQAQSKSNTKAVAQSAISSIADKMTKSKLEDRILSIEQNRYNYRFGPNGYAWNMNAPYKFDVGELEEYNPESDSKSKEMYEKTTTRDKNSQIMNTKEKTRVTKGKNGSLVKYVNGL